jgi:hypothetical protein
MYGVTEEITKLVTDDSLLAVKNHPKFEMGMLIVKSQGVCFV